MTIAEAVARLHDMLTGHYRIATTANRAPGTWVPVEVAALEALLGSEPIRSMGCEGAERKRAGMEAEGGRTGVLPLGVAAVPLTAAPSSVPYRYDPTPPRPQDRDGSDYAEELWQSIEAEGCC